METETMTATPAPTMGDAPVEARPARAESTQMGRAARAVTARESLADWAEPAGRGDPIALLAGQNASRLPWLVPCATHG